ncbi:FAD-dependent monooxygenase [Kineococcus gynurae]|uniref:FAD-dependent monooxygenase n=1 Tax=Kineococcus gynurae TaxID=452979 RepID=A0ABV5LNE7_9ACTN
MGRGSVLISGGGVTGPTLAFWLERAGWRVTVLERAPAARPEGHNVDVRGAGREVLRRMGLEEAALERTTTEEATVFVDADGRDLARFPAPQDDTRGLTAELEILRSDLAGLLQTASADAVEYRYGDSIARVHDTGTLVRVALESGEELEVDAVLVAEGVNSRTRTRVFGGPGTEGAVRRLGAYCAYLAIPRSPEDEPTWRWYTATGGRSVHLRPDAVGTTRALLTFLSDTPGLDRVDEEGQRRVLRRVYADAGWQTPRVLDGLDAAPFYLEDLAQVHLPTWSRGRVALVGDSAWCATPISGMGTTLALTGAYVLARELGAPSDGDDPRAAFRRAEERLRPFVTRGQKLPPGTPRLAHPRSRAGLAAMRAALTVAGGPVGRGLSALGARFASPPADTFQLPPQ